MLSSLASCTPWIWWLLTINMWPCPFFLSFFLTCPFHVSFLIYVVVVAACLPFSLVEDAWEQGVPWYQQASSHWPQEDHHPHHRGGGRRERSTEKNQHSLRKLVEKDVQEKIGKDRASFTTGHYLQSFVLKRAPLLTTSRMGSLHSYAIQWKVQRINVSWWYS